jgi:uncharacterized protein YebE (UPF0316 family)
MTPTKGTAMTFIQDMLNNQIFSWVLLPLLIFLARICDVSIGTVRIIYVARGKRFLAPLLGFFEVSIWLLAISQIMQQLDNIACFIAYAAGFAMGNYVGIRIEEKLAMGTLILRIFLTGDDTRLKDRLYEAGFGVTTIDAHGRNGDVEILFSVIKRKDLQKAVGIIESCQSNAFYSIEDAKSVNKGIFPSPERRRHLPFARRKPYIRQGK